MRESDADQAGAWPRAAMGSDTGRVRTQNQDACLVDRERRLYAVADGIGGQQAGDVAARTAVELLPGLLDEVLGQLGPDRGLHAAVTELSGQIRARGERDPDLTGMGTTIVIALLVEDDAVVAHVGDSRAYLLRGERLRRLTEDHSYANELVRGGLLDPAKAARHPFGQRLTQAVGTAGEIKPTLRRLPLMPGDRLLLCSDGLTKMLSDERIERVLRDRPDPAAACGALVTAANDAGGFDNVSVVVIDPLPPPPPGSGSRSGADQGADADTGVDTEPNPVPVAEPEPGLEREPGGGAAAAGNGGPDGVGGRTREAAC